MRILKFNLIAYSLLLSLMLFGTGCYNLARPQVFNPGTIEQQQLRAMMFDPYPDEDAGPELTGVRPRQFDRPMAEATKSQPYAFWGQ